MNSPEAAKNILNGKSCYDCCYFNDKLKACVKGLVPKSLLCEKWDSITNTGGARRLHINWTKETEKDMKVYRNINVEDELAKLAQLEIDEEVKRDI